MAFPYMRMFCRQNFRSKKMDSFTDENFETLSGVRHQITNVSFDNALVRSLNGLYTTLYLDYTYEGKEMPERALKDAVHETYGTLKQMLSE